MLGCRFCLLVLGGFCGILDFCMYWLGLVPDICRFVFVLIWNFGLKLGL